MPGEWQIQEKLTIKNALICGFKTHRNLGRLLTQGPFKAFKNTN